MIYIYKLPEQLSTGRCFGGGRPITFTNVDWMNSCSEIPAMDDISIDDFKQFIAGKNYVDGSPLMVVDTAGPHSGLIRFDPCTLCNNAGMDELDICAACGRIERPRGK